MAREYDHLFKLLIIGDSGVGKSSIMTRFADDVFSGTYICTIGVDFKIRTLVVNGKKVRLQIWDTAGQERFKTITTTFYRGAHGVLVVYDITRTESFNGVKKWLQEIESNCDINVNRILVGNKIDREESRVVSTEEGQRVADEMNIPFLETSAKSNHNVEALFTKIAQCVIESSLQPKSSGTSDGLRVRPRGPTATTKSKCCA